MKKIAFLLCLVMLLPGAVTAKEKVIELKYKPREKVKVKPKKVPSVKIFLQEIHEGRPNPKEVGENLEDKDKKVKILTADAGEAKKFLRGVLQKEFKDKNFSLVEGPGAAQVIVAGTLLKFWTEETSKYRSNIQLKITVKNKEGVSAFQKTYGGSGKNFGHSLSEVNYQESFSNAAADLLNKIFGDPSFLRALAEAPTWVKGGGSRPQGKGVFGPR